MKTRKLKHEIFLIIFGRRRQLH